MQILRVCLRPQGAKSHGMPDLKNVAQVDNHLRVEGHAKWFAIGDITNLPDGRFGRIAASQGKRAAAYIKALQGGGEPALQKVSQQSSCLHDIFYNSNFVSRACCLKYIIW